MADLASSLAQLDELADELARRGDADLAEKARATAADLRSATSDPSEPELDLISPAEAATMLGITSEPMVMRWAREKLLEGFNVGGRVKVSRASVERFLDSLIVARQRERERDLAEILDAFDIGDESWPEPQLPHIGMLPGIPLSPESPEPLPPIHPGSGPVVVDANVFPHRHWMDRLIASAEAGHIRLFWSPAIIAEATRVMMWIRLRRHTGPMTNAMKNDAFDFVRRWFQRMTEVFEVVEDRPPFEPQWTDTPRDEDDRPIWTAAVRAGAVVVLTENLKDGPPVDDQGFRAWDGILYFHPDTFLQRLDEWQYFYETLQSSTRPDTLQASTGSDPERVEIPKVFQDFIRELGNE